MERLLQGIEATRQLYVIAAIMWLLRGHGELCPPQGGRERR
jgi:hypothetical protein